MRLGAEMLGQRTTLAVTASVTGDAEVLDELGPPVAGNRPGAPEASSSRTAFTPHDEQRGLSASATPGRLRSPLDSSGDTADLAALVRDAMAGDRAAFELLVEHRLERAYRTARAIIGDDADARDATQDAFLRAWRERRQLRDPARFDAWLGRILVNSCRQVLRGRRRRAVREIAASDLLDPVESIVATGPGSDERTASIDAIERAFERLPAGERAILVLHHLEHQSLADVAASLGIPVGTAKSRLHAARQSLERALETELR
ncbi:MAG TPA: RNA polymerase sigma factor [Candidatus Limnocylindrales bacterium]